MEKSYNQIVVVPLSKLSEIEEDLVGSKGAYLGKLFSLRIPVPNGFVITTFAFDKHFTSNNLYEFIQKELAVIDAADSVRL